MESTEATGHSAGDTQLSNDPLLTPVFEICVHDVANPNENEQK